MATAVKKKSAALDKIVVKRPIPPPELLQEVVQASPPTTVNPEFEQKPLAGLNLQTSEEFHGGSELTFSMPTQRGVQQQTGQAQSSSRQASGSGETEDNTKQHTEQRQQDGLRKGEDGVDPKGERSDAQKGADSEERGGGMQGQAGVFKAAQAFDVAVSFRAADLRRLQTEFYRVLEMLAEEKTKQFDPSLVGSLVKTEYDVKKMALRRYEGKPPTRYKAPRVREAVVLMLDNSGSMTEWAEMLRTLAELAAKRRDVEVYLAPNGYVEEQIAPVRRRVSHNEFMRRMSGRKVIYVGDFDGANTPIELSWRNEVIWIAPEGRYRRFQSHDWVKYDESKYKGVFIRAFAIDDVMKALRKALGGAKWIDMCVKCEDEQRD
jgi:hypothetical protein